MRTGCFSHILNPTGSVSKTFNPAPRGKFEMPRGGGGCAFDATVPRSTGVVELGGRSNHSLVMVKHWLDPKSHTSTAGILTWVANSDVCLNLIF